MNNMINTPDLYRTLHSKLYFFSKAYGIFTKINKTLGHKANRNKFQNTSVTECIVQLEWNRAKINTQKIIGEYTNMKNNQNSLKNTQMKQEITMK